MKKFYVVGNKSSKSLSPLIFNYWFKKYKIDAKYGFLELNKNNFEKEILKTIKNKDVFGLNITIPFKEKIIKHIDMLDNHSMKIKAVNCVSINTKIHGINTDWKGYFKTLPRLKNLNKKNIIIIGYGGAAHAIHYVLKKKKFKNIIIINRTKKKLMFENKIKYTLGLNQLTKHLKNADLIINTTPINPINKSQVMLVNKKTILSDIVYSPKETKFLRKFPNNKKIYGIDMLIQQAVPCFKYWFGIKPKIDAELIKIIDKKIT